MISIITHQNRISCIRTRRSRLIQGNKTVEEYEISFMELVKYVPYLDIDERQAERFVYGLNPQIRAMVRMW